MTWANAGLELNPETDPYASDYPFSVEPDRILSAKDLMSIQVRWETI